MQFIDLKTQQERIRPQIDAAIKRVLDHGQYMPTMKPMHLLDAIAYLGYREGDFPEAEAASRTVLSLPFHPYLEMGDQARVVEGICGAIGKEIL